jgi:cardiolipin synthase
MSSSLTVANQITILRLVFVPLLAILIISRHYGAGLAVLMAAAISDAVDGTVARIFKQETPLGVALDPMADKFLMTTAYLTLAFRGALPWWLTVLVLSRDAAMLITALLIVLFAGYRTFHPTLLGKVSTCFQMATIFLSMGYEAHLRVFAPVLVHLSIYLTAALTIASGIHYLAIVQRRYSPQPADEASASPPSIDEAEQPSHAAAGRGSAKSGSRESP